ncbi:hypothetical protein [Pseudoalteromonas distincta]|uniref:Lipoprotein n=1 Tax=Pseudoalteromonas distincta TaxID=77608 RepID=A0ABT9GGU0_9GAMM|nr:MULTISPECIES: hypothetical protein [Pseudoalteromonas distincta group]MDP4485108.1 hypothetical protein [Pseudoalteromonas elyakovii]
MIKYSCILLGIIFIVGCKSTGVVPLGQNSYYVGKKDGSPGLGVSLENKAAVYKEARQFCAEQNLEIKVLKETVTPAAPAKLGSTELEFSCIPLGTLATPTEQNLTESLKSGKYNIKNNIRIKMDV